MLTTRTRHPRHCDDRRPPWHPSESQARAYGEYTHSCVAPLVQAAHAAIAPLCRRAGRLMRRHGQTTGVHRSRHHTLVTHRALRLFSSRLPVRGSHRVGRRAPATCSASAPSIHRCSHRACGGQGRVSVCARGETRRWGRSQPIGSMKSGPGSAPPPLALRARVAPPARAGLAPRPTRGRSRSLRFPALA